MHHSKLPLIVLFVASTACGGTVVVPDDNAGASSATTGSGGQSSGGTTPVTTGGGVTTSGAGVGGAFSSASGVGGNSSAASGIGASSSGGAGGSNSSSGSGDARYCGLETHDTLGLSLATWDGQLIACDGVSAEFDFPASVPDPPAASGPGTSPIILDTCSPASNCSGHLSKLSVTAPQAFEGLKLSSGAWVRVRGSIQSGPGGCTQKVEITRLPTWDGVPNPAGGGKSLLFLAADGLLPPGFDDTTVAIVPIPLGCFPDDATGCGKHEHYELQFRSTLDAGDPGHLVPMGSTFAWGASGIPGTGPFASHNLRSLSTGVCDGPTDFAYWVTSVILPG